MKEFLSSENLDWANRTFEKLSAKMCAECERIGDKIPYIPYDGHYKDLDQPRGIYWWTNGFWSGMLWQMYHATGGEDYRKAAEGIEKRLDAALEGYEGLHHDVGFMWLHSSVANYRLTGNPDSKRRGLHSANLLAGRYNPRGKYIRAWNEDRPGWTIVDSMMNLPLLYWAADTIGDPRYRYIAEDHADNCAKNTVREDGSCNHIVILNPENGDFMENPAGQGFASGSSWSRGQAWALYGFALSHLYSKKPEYLDISKKIAHYFIANAAMADWLPLVDFRSPAEPVRYDSTAGACAACGFLEISKAVGEHERPFYINAAINILKAEESHFCNWNPDEDSILQNGTTAYHDPKGDNVPIIYGDYFFTEGILRLLDMDFMIW